MKKNMLLFLVLVLLAVTLSGCDTTLSSLNETAPQEPAIAWEDMERVEVYLPDFEDEWKADWEAFYEEYKDVVIVVTGVVGNVQYNRTMEEIPVSYAADGRFGKVTVKFDAADRTEQIMELNFDEHVVMEGVLVQPQPTTKYSDKIYKPRDITLEHGKLLEWSEREYPMLFAFDMEPVFEETKAELLEKHSFVKNIEFRVERSQSGTIDRLRFITDVEPGTDPQEVLAYADYGVRLLNENARKIDSDLAPSTGDSYGGLYQKHRMGVWVRPEGVVEAHNKYYVFEWVSARVGSQIKLQKMYR